MRTEGIAVALRPRTEWEAVDLGLELGRAWFGPLSMAWSMAYMTPALLLVAVSPWPITTALIVWLLRPWPERALIEVLARRTFHQPATLGHALRAVLRAPLRPGSWLASLTWRRLSPARTAWLTVWQLEGLRGRAARARIRTLTARGYGACAWCGLLGWGATLLLTLSGILVALSLLPDATGAGVSEWLEGRVPLALSERRTWSLILIAADALCAPWVLVAQFGWYLSRRTDLEAWDVELVFRALARRATTAALLLAALVVARESLHAQTAPSPMPTDESRYTVVRPTPTETVPFDPRQAIDGILKHPDFGRDEVVQQWRLRQWSPGKAQTPPQWLAWLAARMGTLAGLLRVVMWVIAGVVITWRVARRATTSVIRRPARSSTSRHQRCGATPTSRAPPSRRSSAAPCSRHWACSIAARWSRAPTVA